MATIEDRIKKQKEARYGISLVYGIPCPEDVIENKIKISGLVKRDFGNRFIWLKNYALHITFLRGKSASCPIRIRKALHRGFRDAIESCPKMTMHQEKLSINDVGVIRIYYEGANTISTLKESVIDLLQNTYSVLVTAQESLWMTLGTLFYTYENIVFLRQHLKELNEAMEAFPCHVCIEISRLVLVYFRSTTFDNVDLIEEYRLGS